MNQFSINPVGLYLYKNIGTFSQDTYIASQTKMQVLDYKAKHLNHVQTKPIVDCYILAEHSDLKYPSIKERHITLEF